MIDGIEPLSTVLWAVFFFAASMYPLGFMLGGSCSPCCGSQCDEVFEFNRCVRFVNTDQTAPPTTLPLGADTTAPLHGFSRSVSRPEHVGAIRVPTKLDISFGVVLEQYATRMSDGETRTATYTVKYNTPEGQQDAVKWTVTLQGVTLPLAPPPVIAPLSVPLSATPQTTSHSLGDKRISQSAAPSVSVHGCTVISGGQWLDGQAVSEATLKGMLSVSIDTPGDTIFAMSVFTPTPSVFQYVPRNQSVVLQYVIEHARGSTRRYSTRQITVVKDSAPSAIPEGGLVPISIQPSSYADTPFTITPPVFAGDTPTAMTATIYSDNAAIPSAWIQEQGSFAATASKVISFPDVAVSPSGVQMRHTSLFVARVDGEYLAPVNGSGASTVRSRGWIMRPWDRDRGQFNGHGHPAENAWIYDTELVAQFLNGETTVPYHSGGVPPLLDGGYRTDQSQTWTMQVTEATQFCGKQLCSGVAQPSPYQTRATTQADVVERVVTCKPGTQPQTWISSDEKQSTTYTNHCYGQDAVPAFAMHLGFPCAYAGSRTTCQSLWSSLNDYIDPLRQGPAMAVTRSLALRAFYCGDLLWVIENGPCRTSITQERSGGWGDDVYTLGGDDSLPYWSGVKCASSLAPSEKCYSPEVEVTISDVQLVGKTEGATVTGGSVTACYPCGSYLSAGVPFPGGTAAMEGTFVLQPWIPGGCLRLDYLGVFTIGDAVVEVGVGAGRRRWCVPMYETAYGCRITRGQHSLGIGSGETGEWDETGLGRIFQKQPGHVSSNRVPGTDIWFCDTSTICSRITGPGTALVGAWASGGFPDRTAYTGTASGSGFGIADSDPVAPSVTPRESTIGREGGTVSLAFCCPPKTVNVTIPPSAERYERTFYVPDSGAVAYITQAGYDGESCPFSVTWLTGSTGFPRWLIYPGDFDPQNPQGRLFSAVNCPIVGQVTHNEQPGCEWSVESFEDWVVAEQTEDGLLGISIDDSVTPVFSGSLYNRPYRVGLITISSGGSTQSWLIAQTQP